MSYKKHQPMKDVLRQKFIKDRVPEKDVEKKLNEMTYFIEGRLPDHVHILNWNDPVKIYKKEMRKAIFKLAKEFMFGK